MNGNLKNNPRFCIVPFMVLNTRTTGGVKPCSEVDMPLIKKGSNVDNIYDIKSYQLNLTTDSIDEVWNSDFMKDFRNRKTNGEYVKPCETCYQKEQLGKKSKRQAYLEKFFEKHKDLVQESMDNNGEMKTMPIWWELRFSSTCNESCRMCNAKSSSRMREEFSGFIEELPITIKENTIKSIQDFDKFGYLRDDNFFLQQFYKSLPNIQYLEIHGGEPTTDTKLFEVLKNVVESGHADHIYLHVHSNIHRLRKKDIELWNQFKSGWLGISIDAYKEENEYIRYGSKWHNLEKNLKMVKELGNHWKKIILTTVMSYNVCTLHRLASWYIDYVSKNDFQDLKWMCLTLTTPELMRPEQISTDLRRASIVHLVNLLGKHTNSTDDSIRNAISILESNFRPSKESFKEFTEYTKLLDKKRQQSVINTFPHFRDIFKNG